MDRELGCLQQAMAGGHTRPLTAHRLSAALNPGEGLCPFRVNCLIPTPTGFAVKAKAPP